MKILVVDDDPIGRKVVARAARSLGHETTEAEDGESALERFEASGADVIISDWYMPGMSGLDLCERVRASDRAAYTYFILLTVADRAQNARTALGRGADDFLGKPLDPKELESRLLVAERIAGLHREVRSSRVQVERLGEVAESRRAVEGMVGNSAAMQEVYRGIRLAAPRDVPVLVTGESGTGKELVARALHVHGARPGGPFVAVNCSALPEPILESELFGAVRGAYTGADRDRTGLLEAASGGTVFLDEVGEMSPAVQAKLLRTIENRTVRPVGASEERSIDVRWVAATNRDLGVAIDDGSFREDLYYRLGVFRLELPALRNRVEDLPELVDRFIDELVARTGSEEVVDPAVSEDAVRCLRAHTWSGNVRELRNALESAWVLREEGQPVRVADLPAAVRRGAAAARVESSSSSSTASRRGLARDEIVDAVRATDGNRAAAARRLGISRVALWKRIRKLDIEDDLPPSLRGRRPGGTSGE